VQVSNNSRLSVEATGEGGKAGGVTINTQQLSLTERSQLSASNISGESQDITLQGLENLQLTNGSEIAASTRTGTAGSVSINTGENPVDLVSLNNSRLSVEATGEGGKAGGVTINTQHLSLTERSQLSASNISGISEDITLQGLDTLEVNNSLISASTQTGRAGSLSVNATAFVDLKGVGGLSVEATNGGTAGNLTVETEQISVQDGAAVTVSSPSGQAGNLNIQANSVHLNRGTLRAETGKSSSEGGANITLNGLDLLRLDNESQISASAFDQATGGNITIDSTFIVATPPTGSKGSDITANAVQGNGGRVNITTQGLFGIQLQPQLTPKNDITVSSQFGLTGEFQLNTPDVDPSRGLINLPTAPVDTEVSQACQAGATQNQNSFIITGRGGLPPNPRQVLRSRAVEVDWVTLDASANNPTEAVQNRRTQRRVSSSPGAQTANNVNTQPPEIVEAQGWVIDDNGKITLVATAVTATPHSSWQKPADCHTVESTN
jgi:large exoprotein involved in heme utilization and adhesion